MFSLIVMFVTKVYTYYINPHINAADVFRVAIEKQGMSELRQSNTDSNDKRLTPSRANSEYLHSIRGISVVPEPQMNFQNEEDGLNVPNGLETSFP